MDKYKCENCDYYNGLKKENGCQNFHLFDGGCLNYIPRKSEEQVKQEQVDNCYFESLTNETVNHPKHYEGHTSIECIDNMCLIFGATATHNYCLMNAYKYMSRHKFKNGMEDLQKARWYLDHAISLQYGYNLIVNNEQFETLCSLCERYMIDYEEE